MIELGIGAVNTVHIKVVRTGSSSPLHPPPPPPAQPQPIGLYAQLLIFRAYIEAY